MLSQLRSASARVVRRLALGRAPDEAELMVRGERRALRWLSRCGGQDRAAAMTAALRCAEAYRTWDNWSLAREALVWAAELVADHDLRHVVEFGAGYSTVALATFIAHTGRSTRLDAFEHQPEFAAALAPHLPAGADVHVHDAPLRQVSDVEFEATFSAAAPWEHFDRVARPVPRDQWRETRLTNVFYDLSRVAWPQRDVDLVLLDGPNGNGRSLAFAFLRDVLRLPAWVIVDDYDDYPFLDYLNRVFAARVERRADYGRNRFVRARIEGVRRGPAA